MNAIEHAALEQEQVIGWRRAQLELTGFPARLAADIALDARYDLHALIELVERGCRPELAVRVLAPLDEERWV